MLENFEEEINLENFHTLSKSTKWIIFNERFDIIERIVKEQISPKRYAHSKSVAQVCVSLAKKWHFDEKLAYQAGILHDCTKSLSKEEHLAYLNYYGPSKVDNPEPILHSYSAVYFIKEKFNYYNKDVLNAIYHHTDGQSNATLAKILYIADKREPLRGLDPYLLNLAYEDLTLAFNLLKEDVKEYVKNNHGK